MKQQLGKEVLPRSLGKDDELPFIEWRELDGCFLMLQWDGSRSAWGEVGVPTDDPRTAWFMKK